MNIQAIILCGGSGTRLWPLSRQHHPKQLLSLFDGQTMLQQTVQRLSGLNGFNANRTLLAVAGQEYRFMVAEQLRQSGLPYRLLLEPCARGTATALAAAAACADRETVLLVMPADHLIQDHAAFHQAVETAYRKAEENAVICFGITPDYPHTGYGYIKTSPQQDSNILLLDKFIEKPDVQTASDYLKTGSYYWNSGIFMLKAGLWLDLLARLQPETAKFSQEAVASAQNDRDFLWLDPESFSRSPNDSIDYAVMEHIGTETQSDVPAFVVPLAAEWSDIGSWDAVWQQSEKDENGNAVHGSGSSLLHESRNNLLYSSNKRTLALLGVQDIVAIDTHDAVLIAQRDRLPEMRQLIARLQQENPELLQSGQTVYRPWGHYQLIDSGAGFQVKRINVKPQQILSLQKHRFRSEHWIVVNGTCRIQRGEENFILQSNQSTYIPQGVIHRLENIGSEMLELIEVQSGSYLGEDDIERFEDIYGRIQFPTSQ